MTLRPRAFLLLVLLGLPLALSLAASNKVQTLSIIPGFGIEVLTAAGQTAQYTAFAQEQMGSGPTTTANVTNSVTWSTSNPNIATINSSGLATAVGAGYVEITAVASDGAIASSDLTVELAGSTTQSTPSITILPSTAAETFVGETTQFTATGNLTGIGNAQNVTNQVTWLSSNAQVATVNSSGLATAVGAGTTMIVAESGGLNASATVTVAISSTGTGTPSITVTPNSASDTFAGETTQFIASGNLTGVGGPLNLTNTVTWLSSNAQVATINSAGLATAVGAGTTTITAESGGLNATVSLTVSVPASGSGSGTPTLAVVPSSVAETFSGETTQFTATGNLTGIGAIQNLTNQVSWVSSNVQVATINAAGLATAVGSGTTTIIAESGGLTANATLGVTIAASGAPSISVIPNTVAETFAGETTQLTASGNLTGVGGVQNLTNQVTWLSSNVQVATVSATGLVTSVSAGTTTIIAESGGLNASSTVTVTLPASGSGSATPTLTVTPGSASETFAGETTQFLATGNLTGVGTSQNLTSQVTWYSSNAQVATINAAGLATAVGAGTTSIVALAPAGGLSATASLSVTISASGTGTPTLVITPNSETETFTGEVTQFFATGNLTGVGGTQDLTGQVTWSSSNSQVATIIAGGVSAGLATATGFGSTLITAQSGAVSAVALLTVSNNATTPQTPTLIIIPGAQSFVGPGGTAQLLAIGNLAGNGQVQNLTNTVTWISSSPGVASVSATGLVRSNADPAFGLSDGTVITAIAPTTTGNNSVITSSINVTVTSQYTSATTTPPPVLTVTLLGTQNGSVVGMSGTTQVINCGGGGTNCSAQVVAGTPITLTETPGTTFGSWSGNCTVTSPTSCSVIVSNDVTVSATFN